MVRRVQAVRRHLAPARCSASPPPRTRRWRPPSTLTAADLRFFDEHGYVVVPRAVPPENVAAARADTSPNCVSANLAEGEAAEVVPAERSVADRRCFTPLACCAARKTGSAKRMRVERTSGEQPLWHREERTSQSSDV